MKPMKKLLHPSLKSQPVPSHERLDLTLNIHHYVQLLTCAGPTPMTTALPNRAMEPLGIWHGAVAYLAVLSVLALMASVAVAVRFWSRRLMYDGFHADDWLALAALVFHHAVLVLLFTMFINCRIGWDTERFESSGAVDGHFLLRVRSACVVLRELPPPKKIDARKSFRCWLHTNLPMMRENYV